MKRNKKSRGNLDLKRKKKKRNAKKRQDKPSLFARYKVALAKNSLSGTTVQVPSSFVR